MIDHLDHLVLTTFDESACVDFYTRVLGMTLEAFETGSPPQVRTALRFGTQKINLHVRGREYSPRAHVAAPGTLDLCFMASMPLERVIEALERERVPILEGPVYKTGATGRIRSVYVRDPDLNLIEMCLRGIAS